MKIYTKTGDKGMTFNGKDRVPKYDCSIDGQGELDELNAWIGMIRKSIFDEMTNMDESCRLDDFLEIIQTNIFNMGGQLATRKSLIQNKDVEDLELEIDKMEGSLPELKNFVYPHNNPSMHVARSVCRRAERVLIAWRDSYKECSQCGGHSCMECVNKFEVPIMYLNRLSDYLFVLSRYWQFEQDELWISDRNDH